MYHKKLLGSYLCTTITYIVFKNSYFNLIVGTKLSNRGKVNNCLRIVIRSLPCERQMCASAEITKIVNIFIHIIARSAVTNQSYTIK